MANGFGSQMDPLAGPAQTSPPRSPEEFEGLRSSWMGFLTRPETQAGLLQFTASVLQPVGRGQSVLGNIGMALGDAGAAAGRAATAGANEQQRQIENVQKERQIAVQERGQEQNAQIARENVQIAREQMGQEAGQFQQTMALQLKQLGVDERRADIYAQAVGQAGRSTTPGNIRDKMMIEAMRVLGRMAGDAAQYGDEFDYDAEADSLLKAIDALAGQTAPTMAPGTPTGAGGASGAPAPGTMATNVLVQMAKDAIAAGADRNAVAQRLREQGVDPALLGQ